MDGGRRATLRSASSGGDALSKNTLGTSEVSKCINREKSITEIITKQTTERSKETQTPSKKRREVDTNSSSAKASTSGEIKGKDKETGGNGDIDDEGRNPKRRKIDDPVDIDGTTRQRLHETLEKMRCNIETINSIRFPKNMFDSKISKQDLSEVESVTKQALKLGRIISTQLLYNPQISQFKIDRLTNIHSRRIQAWANYLHDRYERDDESAQRPKSTGTKEWHEASRGRRPKNPERMAAYAEGTRRVKKGVDLDVEDIYSRFGDIPYGFCKPGERDDITDVRFPMEKDCPGNGERVRVIQINKPDSGITFIFPRVGPNGDLSQIWKQPYRAGAYVAHGNGFAPSVDTIKRLGYTWGPLFLGNSHTIGAAVKGMYKHFVAHNDMNNPKDVGRWIMINGSVTAPTFKPYSFRPSNITSKSVFKALQAGAPDKPVTNGNYGAGAGDGNDSFGFPSGTGSCSSEIRLRNEIGELDTYTISVHSIVNFARTRYADFGGTHLEDAYHESEKRGVHKAQEGERGSVNTVLITDIGLTSHQLQDLAEHIGSCYSKYSYNAHFSHDVVYTVSLANTDTIPEDPNFNPNIKETSNECAFVQSRDLSVKLRDTLFELAKLQVEKALFKSVLASRDMTENGKTGNRMPHEGTLNAFYYSGRFAPQQPLTPLSPDRIPDGIDKARFMEEQVKKEDYTDYYSESGDESD